MSRRSHSHGSAKKRQREFVRAQKRDSDAAEARRRKEKRVAEQLREVGQAE